MQHEGGAHRRDDPAALHRAPEKPGEPGAPPSACPATAAHQRPRAELVAGRSHSASNSGRRGDAKPPAEGPLAVVSDHGGGVEFETATVMGQSVAEFHVLTAWEPFVEATYGQEIRPAKPDVAGEHVRPSRTGATAGENGISTLHPVGVPLSPHRRRCPAGAGSGQRDDGPVAEDSTAWCRSTSSDAGTQSSSRNTTYSPRTPRHPDSSRSGSERGLVANEPDRKLLNEFRWNQQFGLRSATVVDDDHSEPGELLTPESSQGDFQLLRSVLGGNDDIKVCGAAVDVDRGLSRLSGTGSKFGDGPGGAGPSSTPPPARPSRR